MFRKKQPYTYAQGLNYALRLLQQRNYSEYSLRQKLSLHLVTAQDQDAIISKLKELNMINDSRYAASVARTESTYRWSSNQRITQKLLTKGINKELAKQSLDHLDQSSPSEHERALHHARRFITSFERRHAHTYDPRILKQKLYTHLQQKGFAYAIIKQATEDSLR